MSQCPSADNLNALLAGTTTGENGLALEVHVEHCGQCQQRIETLLDAGRSDSFRLLIEEDAGDGPAERILERVKEAAPTLAQLPHRQYGPGKEEHQRFSVPETQNALPDVPGYELLEELGRGGMGVVYKARQTGLNRFVALKMILPGMPIRTEDRARFRTEAEAVARLQHPNIVQIYEIGEHAGCPYFSMEFIPGGTLAQRLLGLPQPARAAAQLLEITARAMDHAHQQGIIHRDLKPANILLQQVDNSQLSVASRKPSQPQPADYWLLATDYSPKITDFGLAKRVGDLQQTQRGLVIGTLGYMSPEQASWGKQGITPAADIYSLGAILYEMLTGRPPFRAETWSDALVQLERDNPLRPSRLQTRLPHDLETICLKCLAKEPHKRYATAADLAADLRRFLDGQPVQARPTPLWEQAWKWARRQPVVAALSAAVVLTIAVAAVVVSFQWRTAVASAKSEAATRQQTERLLTGATLDRAVMLCERGDVAQGLLWLARGLEMAVQQGDPGLERVARDNLAGWRDHLFCVRFRLPHASECSGAVLGPDGRTVWICSEQRTVAHWDLNTGQAVGAPLHHARPVTVLTGSADGRTLWTGTGNAGGPGEIHCWDMATGQPREAPAAVTAAVRTLTLDRSERQILLVAGDKAEIRQLPLSRRGRTIPHPGPVRSAILSEDGNRVLTIGSDGKVFLWDLAIHLSQGRLLPYRDPVRDASFSPDGEILATATQATGPKPGKSEIRFWHSRSGEAKGPAFTCPGEVQFVSFSPDGRLLLAGTALIPETPDLGAGGAIHVWETATGKSLGPPLEQAQYVERLAFNPDKRTLLTTGGMPRLRLIANYQPVGPRLTGTGFVRTVLFSPDGTLAILIPRSPDTPAQVWEIPRGRALDPPWHHGSRIFALALSPDGCTLATGGDDGTVQLWDLATGRPRGAAFQAASCIHGLAFRPDSRVLAVAGDPPKEDRGQVVLCSASDGRPLGSTISIPFNVRGLAFSPDGKFLAVGGLGGVQRLSAAGELLGPPLASDCVYSVAFAPDSQTFLAGGTGGVRTYETATGRLLRQSLSREGDVTSLVIRSDGNSFIAGTLTARAQLWWMASGEPVGPIFPHFAEVKALALSPDGRTLLTGSLDGTARLWDVLSGKPLGPPLPHRDKVMGAAFLPDGRGLVTGNVDGSIQFWELPPPMPGGPEEIRRQVEVLTGLELDANGVVRGLDPGMWQQRRMQLLDSVSQHSSR
jgi:serine/threonine protein kinase/WD40 repeat protein